MTRVRALIRWTQYHGWQTAAAVAVVLTVAVVAFLVVDARRSHLNEADTTAHLRGLVDEFGRATFCHFAAGQAGSSNVDAVTDYLVDADDLDRSATRSFLAVQCVSLTGE